jgi:hypothetical protein
MLRMCVCAFSLHRGSPDQFWGKESLISEVVLSHLEDFRKNLHVQIPSKSPCANFQSFVKFQNSCKFKNQICFWIFLWIWPSRPRPRTPDHLLPGPPPPSASLRQPSRPTSQWRPWVFTPSPQASASHVVPPSSAPLTCGPHMLAPSSPPRHSWTAAPLLIPAA